MGDASALDYFIVSRLERGMSQLCTALAIRGSRLLVSGLVSAVGPMTTVATVVVPLVPFELHLMGSFHRFSLQHLVFALVLQS